MSFPRYPKYKDSGVEWAGAIPDSWTPTRLRFLLRDGYDGLKIGPFGSQLKSEMLDDGGAFKVYGQENIIANDFTRGSRFISEEKFDELSVYEIKPGDLLITMMGTSGRCDVAPTDITQGIMDSHLLRMRVTSAVQPEFVRILIDEAAYVATQIQLTGKGSIMHGLNSAIVKNLLMFVPPPEEQNQILAFLDRETAKIDGLVAEQRRLMELLKEKRQAVISHAVTKGLNPDAPMKPSGIEWLGDVPEHWRVVALKQLVSRPIIDGPHESPQKLDEGIPFMSAESISKGFLDFDKKWGYISPEDHKRYSQRYKPKPGDILLVKLGATTGTPAIVETDAEFNIWVPLAAIRPKSEIESRFVFHVLRSDNLKRAYELSWTYGTQQTLGLGTIANLRIPLPPIKEQQEIVQHLDSILPSFESLTAEAQRAIDLLQERRTALISAAVTGQIDVRD